MDPAAACPRCESPVTPQDLACPHCGSQVASFPRAAPSTQGDAAPLLPERYQVLRMLGRGGMGRVWLCRDQRLDVDVAVKVLPAEISADAKALRRIEEEAKMAARLRRCPNILALYGFEHHEGIWFLVMEYAAGGSLFDRLRNDRRLPEKGCRRVGAEVADALAYAHALGVLHRDIKPGNILLDIDGRAKVADFGLARVVTGGHGDLSEMPVEGTPVYMAPEIILRRGVDGRADLYALGAMLFELATGAAPFRGSYAEIAMAKTASDSRAPDPREFRPDLTAEFGGIVTRLLEPDPGRRFPGAAACAEALRRGLGDSGALPVVAPAAGAAPRDGGPATPQSLPEFGGKRKRGFPVLAAVAVAAALGAGALLLRGTGATKEPEAPPPAPEAPAPPKAPPETVVSEGIVVITRPPGAEVLLDGVPAGAATAEEGLRLEGAAEGLPHVVEARLADHEPAQVSGLVWRKGNPRQPVVLTLVRQKGMLTLEGGRPGAKVVLRRGEEFRREAALGADGRLGPEIFEAGTYDAEVSLKGYRPWTGRVRVAADRGPAVRIEMAECDGTLSVDTDPTTATVIEGEVTLGVTPVRGLAIAAGKHVLRLRHPDAAERSVEVAVRGEEAQDLGTVRLDPLATVDAASLEDGIAVTVGGVPAASFRGEPGKSVPVVYAKAGFRPQTRRIALKAGPNRLPGPPGGWTPVPGRIEPTGMAPDTLLLVDGKPRLAPWGALEVDAGVHDVRLAVRGGAAVPLRLSVRGDETVALPGLPAREAKPARPPTLPANWNAAVEAGLEWLRLHQSPSGLWDADGFEAQCKRGPCGGKGQPPYDPGITGLAVLAFTGAGDAGRKPENEAAARAGLAALVALQDADGCFGPRTTGHFTYNHAIATIAVLEGWRRFGDAKAGAAAAQGVAFVERCRNPWLAWRYGIRPGDNDTSVSAWMTWALRGGVEAGFPVDGRAFEGMRTWLDRVTDPGEGRTGYTARGNGPARPQELMDRFPPEGSESMTAEAFFSRLHMGAAGEDEEVQRKALAICLRCLPAWDEAKGRIDLYYWFFGTRSCFAAGGEAWKRWRDALGKALLEHQRLDRADDRYGSWDPLDPWAEDGGRVYATALNLLSLETPLAVPPPAEAPPRTLLSIRSDPPGAAVFQAGTWLGTTPLANVPAAAGSSTVRLVHPERAAVEVPVSIAPFASHDAGTVPLPPGGTLELAVLPQGVEAACNGRRLSPGKAPIGTAVARLLFSKPGAWTQVHERRVRAGETAKAAPGPWEAAPEWRDAGVPGLPAPPRPESPPPDLPPGFRVEGGRIWCERDRAEMVHLPAEIVVEPGGVRRELPALLVDRHEVTVGQHGRFLQFLDRPGLRKFTGTPRYPVAGAAMEEAEAFATWAGKRLPTPEEWERIAAVAPPAEGEDPWPFPWGPVDSPGARNLAGTEDTESRIGAVGKYFAGMTPLGLFDVIGNAAELCSDGVARGGGWGSARPSETRRPGAKEDPAVGFRCVASLVFPTPWIQAWRLHPKSPEGWSANRFPTLPGPTVAEVIRALREEPPFMTQRGLVDVSWRNPGPTFHRTCWLLALVRCEGSARVRMLTGSDDGIRVWLNEKQVLQALGVRGWIADTDRTEVDLREGENTVLVEVSNDQGPGLLFSLRFESLDGTPWLHHADGTLKPGK